MYWFKRGYESGDLKAGNTLKKFLIDYFNHRSIPSVGFALVVQVLSAPLRGFSERVFTDQHFDRCSIS